MPLDEEIEAKRKEIRTDGYAMSIGEWISLYERNEIDIHPEFQRVYRWDETQKSKFIESILLGIPIPPVFVSQRHDGVWDVIDGVQRLSTIYEFAGVLKDENDKTLMPLTLQKAPYLQSMAGKRWEDPEHPQESFTPEQRLLIKRSKIDVSIVLRESDEFAKFELFQRLNTGGSQLTSQEVRNCIAVMTNINFYEWLLRISGQDSFQECIALTDKNIKEKYDVELALRFLVFATIDLSTYDRTKDVGEYLTDQLVLIAENRQYDLVEAEKRFRETFNHIALALGSDAFRRYDGGKFKGGFLLSPFEVVAFGLGFHHPSFPTPDQTKQITQNLYMERDYQNWSGSGQRANARLPHLIPLGRRLFQT